MKRFIFMLVAVFAMTVAANATDYTGSVSNVQMGSKTPTVDETITFSVEDDELTGDFSISAMVPPHHIQLTSIIEGTSFEASGKATVFGLSQSFKGTITLYTLDDTTLNFYFTGTTSTGTAVAFEFSGTAE